MDAKTKKPVDYLFLDVNPAFEALTGLNKEQILGKTVLEVLPQTETVWIEKYGKVALEGAPITFESFSQSLGCFYQVTAFSPGMKQFAVLFTDITERKMAQIPVHHQKQRAADAFCSQ